MSSRTFSSAALPAALGVLLLVVGGARASHADSMQKAIDYRSSVMTVFNWNLKPMGAMMKRETPYDQAAFAAHARDLAAAASLNVLAGFPEDSDMGETDAKAEIWLSWEDFEEKYRDLQTQVAKLAEVAAQGDREQTASQFKATATACKACHKEYKQ